MSSQYEAHQPDPVELGDLVHGAPRAAKLVAVGAPISAAAEAAQEVNARIAAVAETLTVNGDDASYTFFCECGCLQPVPLTLAEYASAACALRAGHAPDG